MTHASAVNSADIAEDVSSSAVEADLLGPRAFTNAHEAFEYIGSVLEFSTECSVISTDPEGVILLWNEGARRLYGYDSSEIIGRPKSLLHTSQDIRAGLPRVMMQEALAHGKWTGAVERVRRDGSNFTARVVMIPRRDTQGRLAGFLLISSDMSGEVRMTAELERANAELAAANRAKDRFLANMSHELRTPLNAILGFTGTLLMGLPGALNDEQTKQLSTVRTSARHLLSLINDLLDLARIESRSIKPKVESVDCRELLDEVAMGLRPLADQRGLKLEVMLPAGACRITTDRRALSQILINLANNAIKFTDRGAVRLELTQHRGDHGRSTRFTVADTGHGIKPADRARLFAAFEQIESSSTVPNEGTGLGLHICQTLAAFIGASITVETEFAKGSAFTLELAE